MTTTAEAVTPLTHWLGGQPTPGQSGRSAPVYNPATGQVQAQVPLASAAEVDAAVQAAREVAKSWRLVPLGRRAEIMFRFRALLDARKDELARIITREF